MVSVTRRLELHFEGVAGANTIRHLDLYQCPIHFYAQQIARPAAFGALD